MAYSRISYVGNGSQTDFTIDFPYLYTSHVGVTVDGIAVAFSFLTDSVVRVTPAPASGAAVVISRSSNRDARLSSFADLQLLNMSDLNRDALQTFYVAQEALDAVAEATFSSGAGDMLAANNLAEVNPASARANIGAVAAVNPAITGNLTLDAAPTNPLHATTKAWVDTQIAGVSSPAGMVTAGSSTGGSASVFKDKSGGTLRFRGLTAGTGVSITEGADSISIDATGAGGGEVNTASNLGAGAGLYKTKSGVDLKFRSLVAGLGISVTEGADTVTVATTGAGGGEVNTMASAGVTGLSVFKEKVGVELRTRGVGAADTTLSTASSTASDILFKVNQANGMVWTTEQRFTGGSAVPTIDPVGHGIGVDVGALNTVSNRVTRTAANDMALARVQSADVTHVVTGTATKTWEWAKLIILDNYCSVANTDQVGLYVKAYKRPGAGSNHWGIAVESMNLSSDMNSTLYGMEIRTDTTGNENGVRSGPLGLFYGHVSGGSSYMDHGILIEPSGLQSGAKLGFGVRVEGRPDVAFYQGVQSGSNFGTSMLQTHGRYSGPVLDTAFAAGASCGLRLKSGLAVRFNGTDTPAIDAVWNSGTSCVEFQRGGIPSLEIPGYNRASDNGNTNYSIGLRTSSDSTHVKTSVAAGVGTSTSPIGYLRIRIDGNPYRIAFYNNN